jgi:hypothetical protein
MPVCDLLRRIMAGASGSLHAGGAGGDPVTGFSMRFRMSPGARGIRAQMAGQNHTKFREIFDAVFHSSIRTLGREMLPPTVSLRRSPHLYLAMIYRDEKTNRYRAFSSRWAVAGWIPRRGLKLKKAQAGPWAGQVTAIHAENKSVSMTRKTSNGTEYLSCEIRPATDFQKLHVGDRVQGRIVVEQDEVFITEIRIIK